MAENQAYVTAGPFGGNGGTSWDDGVHSGVRQLIIYSGMVIDSIQIEYDDNGCPTRGETHGESKGGRPNTVKLDYPTEFLISISGYYDVNTDEIHVVNSLTILSNKKQYGPYGTERGRYFSLPLTSGKIIGFLGRSGLYVDSIGVHLEPCPSILIGPFGGLGGDHWDDGIHTTIRQLKISSASQINFIQIEYDDNGYSKWSDQHGQSEGGTINVVNLDYPDEFLVAISGYYKNNYDQVVVQSLKIQSNKKFYGPFGTEQGTPFSTTSATGKIVGFQGRSGLFLDSIGANFRSFPSPIRLPISIVPFGGPGGNPWDDGIHTTVRSLQIFYKTCIHSIKIEYDDYEDSKWCDQHGTPSNDVKALVELKYPDEFIISISGNYGPEREAGLYTVIQSLTIQSNKQVYGPFGTESGVPFKFPAAGGKIIGFYGKASQYLDSIGAYVEPVLDPYPYPFPGQQYSISIGPFGGDGGSPWDDGSNHTTIRKFIIFASTSINSIQIEYDNKGQSKLLPVHGQSGGGTKHEVKLNYPGEIVLSISGHYGVVESAGYNVVRSLTIESNKKTYGPFGVEKGKYFKFPSTKGKIIGLHGKSGERLDSIGAYFEAFPNP